MRLAERTPGLCEQKQAEVRELKNEVHIAKSKVGHAMDDIAILQQKLENQKRKKKKAKSKIDMQKVEIAKLKDELERTEDMNSCIVCMAAERNVMFSPCGHFDTCATCAKSLTVCPACRAPIDKQVRVRKS